MSILSNELTSVAKELLLEYGELCTFTNTVITGFDVDAQSNTVSTSNYTGYCFPSEYKANEMIERTIQVGDLKVIAGKMSVVPQVGDTIDINSQSHRILDVKRVRVSGNDVIYILQARV